MATRYHLGTRGPGPCNAVKEGCPFGGESGSENHFDSLDEAASAFERSMGGSVNKPLSKDSLMHEINSDHAILEASKGDVSRSTLIALSKHKDPSVRRVVASSPKASVSLLRRLAEDKDEETRSAVASNNNTEVENLTKLVNDKSSLVIVSVVSNANTPKSVIDKVKVEESLSAASAVAANSHGNVSIRMFKRLGKLDDNEVLTRLASNPKAPEAVVAHSTVGVRQANALMESHPNPPAEAVEAAWAIHTANGREPDIDLYLSNDSTPKAILDKIKSISKKETTLV